MTDTDHPITPPPELVEKWANHSASIHRENGTYAQHEFMLATQAARWGADQELSECCKWLPKLPPWSADDLRKHRRPKPPSLKERIATAIAHGDNSIALALLDQALPD